MKNPFLQPQCERRWALGSEVSCEPVDRGFLTAAQPGFCVCGLCEVWFIILDSEEEEEEEVQDESDRGLRPTLMSSVRGSVYGGCLHSGQCGFSQVHS